MSYFNTKKFISRRTMLKASGVSLALPFLSAMLPAHAKNSDKQRVNPSRFVAINNSLSFYPPYFFPEKAGRNYAPSPYLTLLQSHRDDFTVFSGFSHPNHSGASHSSKLTWLTSIGKPKSAGFKNGISIDQLIAKKVGASTRYPYLSLGTSSASLSWNANGVKLRSEPSALSLYKNLFVDGTEREISQRMEVIEQGKSILDTISIPAQKLNSTLGKNDQEKLDEYFSSVRGLEKRLQHSRNWVKTPKPEVDFKVTKDLEKRDVIGKQKLMFELMALALETDSTRVITFDIGGPFFVPSKIQGVKTSWHGLSHHGQSPEKIAELKLIEEAELKAFNHFLSRLKPSQKHGENLLSKTTVLYGSNLGSASSHNCKNLPIIVAGGPYKHGSHVAHDEKNNTPLANLFVSFAQNMGLEIDSFGSSTSSSVQEFS
ncbi:MAG: DUF1552 domain-containing protein [Lentisphaeraceae bacterium]|nr:DUF1552 domain-containing protein [Lentisphaeraceae bacterium]